MSDAIRVTELTMEEAACWSCGEMRAAQFCTACGKVQPPRPVDYFTFFGLPRKLNIDVAALEKEFHELCRRLHPDMYARTQNREQEWSLEQSSLLNDAYRTLRDPIKRTEYLLKLEGVHLEEQSKTATDAARETGEVKKQVVPPDLLEEVFDLNEDLDELRAQKKAGEDNPALVEELGRHKLELEEKYEGLLEELKSLWRQWDKAIDSGSETDLREVRDKMVDVVNRRNYIRNLVKTVEEVLEN